MNVLIVKNDYPLKAWIEIVNNFQPGIPMLIETDLNNIDIESPLAQRYLKEYNWHFKDSHRSLLVEMKRNLTPYEFSYYDRVHNYFGVDQLEQVYKNPNNIICNWDPKVDFNKKPNPCFMTAKLIPEKHYINLSITFRTRDIVKRLYPNHLALKIFMDKVSLRLNKKIGKLFDYSNQIIAKDEDLEKVKSWIEFNEGE